jgi:hypothetical protein
MTHHERRGPPGALRSRVAMAVALLPTWTVPATTGTGRNAGHRALLTHPKGPRLLQRRHREMFAASLAIYCLEDSGGGYTAVAVRQGE